MSETNAHPRPEGEPDEGASYWDARLRNPECSREERIAFETWRASDPANAAAFERLQTMLETLRAASSRPALRAIRDAALQQRARRFSLAGAIAAAITLTITSVFGFQALQTHSESVAQQRAALAAPSRAFVTAIGEQRTVTLEDGTSVILNTQSRLETHFTAGRRDVTLVAGQALFQVAHDAERPFIVTAGDRQVTAIGTQFDVRLDQRRVRVVLVEGRVAVERRPEEGLSLFRSTERRELTPGQEFDSDAELRPTVQPADVNQATLWRDRRASFVDVPLPEAIAEMNRYSSGALIVTDPSMAELRVNGVFRTDQPQAFVNALEEYFPIEAREQPGGDTLLVWRR